MFNQWPDVAIIQPEHLLDACLYANRNELVSALPLPKHPKIAEIGVWRAAFSKFLASELKPRKFYAFDIFTSHTLTEWNGMTGHQLFDGLTHWQYYEREMAQFMDVMSVVEGPSEITLADHADGSFDLVYVDAAHHYDAVKADTELAVKMVAPSGFLLFDDYTLLDPSNDAPYGVVPVVNDLVVNRDWRIVGYALNQGLYCNIALVRAEAVFTSEKAHLEMQRDRLAQERDGLAQDRDRLAQERDRLAQERDRLAQERDGLAQERDACAQERERLREETGRLHQELVTMQHSRSWRATLPLRALAKALRPN